MYGQERRSIFCPFTPDFSYVTMLVCAFVEMPRNGETNGPSNSDASDESKILQANRRSSYRRKKNHLHIAVLDVEQFSNNHREKTDGVTLENEKSQAYLRARMSLLRLITGTFE